MVKAVSNKIQEEVYKSCPKINWEDSDDEDFIVKGFTEYAISPFDHWLTDVEADERLVIYKDFQGNNERKKLYQSYETSLLNFYSSLYDDSKIYIRRVINNDYLLVDLDSKEEYLSFVLNSIREIERDNQPRFLETLIPKYKLLIYGRFDFTQGLMVNDNYKEGLEEIEKIVKMNGLFILV